ncbi:regulator of G-protein signaling 9-binding protein isoform X3 [Sparus aurata]|uniref:regulator of G-protein signaling 9-binding protein isoform X3 n=1 Tax=Sparus aurata TaxID=8175 RepID=UPI0011C0EDF1|nr:regulator of G-protein signaling 9-binding protein-like isoform X3 [Sparus aurata]
MSRWRRSVDELASRRRQQGECDRAQEALSRVTSCFQQLAASLGSSADGSFLRDEMDETRALAHRICRGCIDGIVGVAARVASVQAPWLTLEEEPSPDLSNHIAGLEIMLSEMQLRVRQNFLITTADSLWLLRSVSHTWTGEVSCILYQIILQVPVAFWSVEATQPAWAEAGGELDEPDDSLEDLMEVEVVSNSNNKMTACCQPPCCGLGCVG